jgi:dolichol-phosphate mannosyltransferase
MATALAFPIEERSRFHPATPSYELAVIVPTFNEVDNVGLILERLDSALQGIPAEIIFVDDWSADGTAARIADLAAYRPDVRVIRRWQRHGLSSAVIEGMMATMAPVVAVIDGDGQHDETLLPRLFETIDQGDADVAIGSRYCADGSTGCWDAKRVRFSRAATGLAQLALRAPVKDPMSGFFAIRRETVEALLPRLSGRGFKILFDLLSSSPKPLQIAELPYRFRSREAGESKLGPGIVLDYAVMVADRLIRRAMPSRFAMYAAVGTLGLGVHLVMLRLALSTGATFAKAQTIAVLVAILFNFVGNNAVTFRDRRLIGRRLWIGLATFYAACGLGALGDIGMGIALFSEHHRWWVSGIAGGIVGSLWNFGTSIAIIWRKR